MILSFEEIHDFIKIDFEEENNLLKLLEEASIEAIKDMTGYDMNISASAKSKIVCLALINEMYKDRGLTTDKAAEKIRPVYNGIIIQLHHDARKQKVGENDG